MKKVIFLVPWLSGYGGTETVIHNLFRAYFCSKEKEHIKFELYSIGGFINNTNLNFKNVHVIQLFNNSLLFLFKRRFFRNCVYAITVPFLIFYILLKEYPNIVIATNPVLWTIAKFYIKLFHLNIYVIGWYHYSFLAKHVSTFYLKQPDYYFVISKSNRKELIEKGVNASNIFVMFNPIMPSKNIIQRSKNCNHFVYVGRIDYDKQKNISELFRALSYVHDNWSLKIYGKCVNKKDLYALKKLSVALKISNHIQWMGFQSNVFNKINVSDALLLSSNYEGFPMVIAEAMSHGLYVISSDCPNGPSELINGLNGSLYKMHDIRQLSFLINNVINGRTKNISQRKIMNSISYLYVSNYYRNFINKLKIVLNE